MKTKKCLNKGRKKGQGVSLELSGTGKQSFLQRREVKNGSKRRKRKKRRKRRDKGLDTLRGGRVVWYEEAKLLAEKREVKKRRKKEEKRKRRDKEEGQPGLDTLWGGRAVWHEEAKLLAEKR